MNITFISLSIVKQLHFFLINRLNDPSAYNISIQRSSLLSMFYITSSGNRKQVDLLVVENDIRGPDVFGGNSHVVHPAKVVLVPSQQDVVPQLERGQRSGQVRSEQVRRGSISMCGTKFIFIKIVCRTRLLLEFHLTL